MPTPPAELLRDYKMSRAQLDALWTYVGHKGEFGRAIAKTEEEVAQKLMGQIKQRGHQEAPPAIATECQAAQQLSL